MLSRSSIPDVSALTPMRIALLVLCVLLFSVNATLFGVAIYTHVTYGFISVVTNTELLEAMSTGLGIALSLVAMTGAALGTAGVIKDNRNFVRAATGLLVLCAVVASAIAGATTPVAGVVYSWMNGTEVSATVPGEVGLLLNLARYECRGLTAVGHAQGQFPVTDCITAAAGSDYLKSKYNIVYSNNTWQLKELQCSKMGWLNDKTIKELDFEGPFNALVLGGFKNAMVAVSSVCIISILLELALFVMLIVIASSDAASDVLGVVMKNYRAAARKQDAIIEVVA